MTRTVVLATQNPDKVREMSALFGDLPVHLVSAGQWKDLPEVIEDGDTLEANALKKAREVAAHTGELCIADDTGLEVEALDGAPGVFAARFAGPDATYADNCAKLLHELKDVPEARRGARFRTVMAVVDPAADGWEGTVEGLLEGRILAEARGELGFGYDPVFLIPERGQTLAEMDLSEKNEISHRAWASRAMLELLKKHLSSA